MKQREMEPELMDDPALAWDVHEHALRGLARINRLSGAARGMWRAIGSDVIELSASRSAGGRLGSVSLLDVASGAGDVPCRLATSAAGRGVDLDLTLLDASETALKIARANASKSGLRVGVLAHDVVASGLPFADRSFDFASCSLFLHHLREDAIVRLLSEMGRVASHGVVVSDLRRSHVGLGAAHVAGRTLTRSRIVRVDSVRSVRASLTCEELRLLATRAGLSEATHGGTARLQITRSWPWRMLLVWRRA